MMMMMRRRRRRRRRGRRRRRRRRGRGRRRRRRRRRRSRRRRYCGPYPIWSTKSHNTCGVGTNGDPSYSTTEAPTARADTNQFHIIQPVCWQQNALSKFFILLSGHALTVCTLDRYKSKAILTEINENSKSEMNDYRGVINDHILSVHVSMKKMFF